MKTKKILAMLLSAMIVMSTTAVSVSADEPEQGGGEPEVTHTHVWSDWSTTVEPTCTTTGTATRVCSGEGECDATSEDTTRTVDALEHNYTVDVDDASNKDATCTAAGSQMKKCSRCEATEAQEIAQLQHSYVGEYKYDAEGTTHTRKCTNGCEEYGAEETCDNTETDCVCGRAKKVVEPEPEPECTHTNTEATPNGDGKTHDVVCTNPDCNAVVADDVTCTDNGDGTCVCGRTMASQEDPGECEHTFTYTFKADGKHTKDCSKEDCDFEAVDEDCTLENGKCKWCGNEPAGEEPGEEPGEKPSTGGSSSSSSSSSSTTKPTVDTKAEANKISTAKAGSKVEVKIEGNTVPASYVQAALSSKATVVVDYGTYAWEISDVKTVKSVDLSINTNARYLVNQNELKALKGDNSNVIDIAHDGNLGFKGTLKYNVKKANAGKYVNLYYYNPTTKKLELQGSTKIGADGNVFLPFTHCSTYVLNITATPASGEVFEDLSAGESATVVEETLPVGNAPAATEAPAQTEAAANPATGNSAAALVAIPVAIAAAAIISKKR